MSHDSPGLSVMMQIPDVGPFVRCLLPVKLSGGFTVTFGVWVAVQPEDLQRAFQIWWEPEYPELTFSGWLANRLPLWGCLASPVDALVRDVDQTPYVTKSGNPDLARVLTEWAHEDVLAALPD
jgi:hypothetical protein